MTPDEAVAALAALPVVLLPVRLETRYVGIADAPSELRIRVYPDQIHVDGHQPVLTEGEVAAGQTYWRNRWTAGNGDTERRAAAWAELTRGIRPSRAAHIVRTTTPTNAPPGEPVFADLPTRPADIDEPLTMRGLPDRWIVIGTDDGSNVVLRKWFDQPVAAGLRASAETTDGPPLPAEEVVDTYLGWTADYRQAVEAGMAVTVLPADVPNGNLSAGFARLVVLGVRGDDGAAELEGLLAAHAVSDGLAFLRPGQPTNNLGGDGPETPTALVPPVAGTVDDPTLPAPELDAEWSAGARLATALGLPARSLGALPGAADTTAGVTSDVVAATWSATLGYFVEELLQPLVSPATVAAAREHAIRHLQPLAPLPTLRVGRQPLGVLPVVATSSGFAAATTSDPFAAQLGGLLARLAPMWRVAASRVPTLRGTGDGSTPSVDAALLAVLQRAPWTMRLRYRRTVGPLLGTSVGGFGRAQELQGSLRSIGFLDGLGLAVTPRIAPFVVRPEAHPLRLPIVGDDLRYLADVRNLTTQADGRTVLNAARDAGSLFEALVRFGALQELDLTAARIGGKVLPGQLPAITASWRTPEVLDDAQATRVSPRILATTIAVAGLGGRTLSQEIGFRQQQPGPPDPDLAELAQFQGALAALERADPAVVELVVRAQLDAAAHRLDAWQTSLASRRLAAVRATRPTGANLGGYGCVERLRPETTPDSSGYVTGPSLAHAATAGVLRSARLANSTAGIDRLDVDLSSTRVRAALGLLRAVREGTPLSILLGYRLERALREEDIARFILPLRTMFPVRSVPDPAPGTPREVTPPHDVVDALSLLDAFMHPIGIFAPLLPAIAQATGLSIGDPPMNQLVVQLEALADVFDAVGDLVLAEAVHQTVAGHPERAQAATRFLDRQEVPVEPDVSATPRRADSFVHRYVIALADPQPASGWAALAADDARAAAEPRVDSWVGSLLGEPSTWGFSARTTGPNGAVGAIQVVTPADLGLGPLSLVCAATAGSGDQPSELEQRIARTLVASASDTETGVELLATTDGLLGLAEMMALSGAVARVLRTARPGDARSLDVPDSAAPPGIDEVELAGRADAAVQRLRTATAALAAVVDGPAPAVRALASAVEAVSRAGMPSAVAPVGLLHGEATTAASTEELDLARAVVAAARNRIEQLDAVGDDRAEAASRRRLAIVFGEQFPVLGTFAVPAELTGVLADGAQATLTGGDPLAVATWLTRMSKVRPELDALWHLLVGAEATTGGFSATEHSIVQLPPTDRARWAALPFDADDRPEGVAVATVVHTPGRRRLDGTLGLLVVDGWTEQIPVAEETAGIALQYDAPSNRAPQVAVLAVPPEAGGDHPWSVDALLSVIDQTLDMAHGRGVTIDELPAVGSVLPALYLPFDLGDDVPSIDLGHLATVHAPATFVLGKD